MSTPENQVTPPTPEAPLVETPDAAPETPSAENTEEVVTATPPEEATPPVTETPTAESPVEPPTETVPERVIPKPDEYALPEGVDPSIGQFAHDNDMTQAQLDAAIAKYGDLSTAVQQAALNDVRAKGEQVFKDWGDQADYNKNLVNRAIAQTDPDGELTQLLRETGYNMHPVVLKHFKRLGDSLREGGFLKSSARRPAGAKKTKAQILYPDLPSSES